MGLQQCGNCSEAWYCDGQCQSCDTGLLEINCGIDGGEQSCKSALASQTLSKQRETAMDFKWPSWTECKGGTWWTSQCTPPSLESSCRWARLLLSWEEKGKASSHFCLEFGGFVLWQRFFVSRLRCIPLPSAVSTRSHASKGGSLNIHMNLITVSPMCHAWWRCVSWLSVR